MKKKIKSTYDEFIESLSPKDLKDFKEGYKEFALSELILALMEDDEISVRKLAKMAGISPTVVQAMRSGSKSDFSMKSFFKVLNGLGYSLIAEKNGSRFSIDLSHINKKG